MSKKRKIHGYAWLSPESYENDSDLLENKIEKIQGFCAKNKLTMTDFKFETSLISKVTQRPVLGEILEGMSPNDFLVVDSLTDLGRRFYDVYHLLQRFGESEGHFVSLQEKLYTGSDEGQNFIKTLQRIPQLQYITGGSSEAASLVFERSSVSRYNGGACPYGYSIDRDTNHFQCVPEESAVVCQIFQERRKGKSLRQIAKQLTYKGVQTKRGGTWQANTIKTILGNVFYTGQYLSQNQLIEKHHPPIIDANLFLDVNGFDSFEDYFHQF